MKFKGVYKLRYSSLILQGCALFLYNAMLCNVRALFDDAPVATVITNKNI